MKLAIMQPYFFPYIGYFQLIAAADTFVIYDNIKYTKKGWINRNRFLLNGSDATFSIPLARDSDFLDVRDRRISPEYQRDKLTRRLQSAYRDAPYYASAFPVIEEIIACGSDNLFEYVNNSVVKLCHYLGVNTQIIRSSSVVIDHGLKGQEKILALCHHLGADEYINTIGGMGLYYKDQFEARGISLKFIKTSAIVYPQFGQRFVPNLSIIDVLMFNPLDQVKEWVRLDCELV